MSHETKDAEQKATSDGCCGGMSKDKTSAPVAVKADAKPAADAKHVDHKKAGSSCC